MSVITPIIEQVCRGVVSGVVGAGGGVSPPISDWQQMINKYFNNGENGLIYVLDPAEGCVFQDAAGTTPCTGPDQPVGLVLDVSGNGNHASQPTTTKRPMLRQDGDLWYLQGDGIDDFMSTGNIDFTATDKITSWVGSEVFNSNVAQIFAFGDNPIATPGAFGLYRSGAYPYDVFIGQQGNVGVQTTGYTTEAPAKCVITESFVLNTAQDLAFTTLIDGVYAADTYGGGLSEGVYGDHSLWLFAKAEAGGAFFFSGNLYSLMIRGAETTDLTPGNEYTASKTGVTLP